MYKEVISSCTKDYEDVEKSVVLLRAKLGVTTLGRRSFYEAMNEAYELSEIDDPREFLELIRLEILFG